MDGMVDLVELGELVVSSELVALVELLSLGELAVLVKIALEELVCWNYWRKLYEIPRKFHMKSRKFVNILNKSIFN